MPRLVERVVKVRSGLALVADLVGSRSIPDRPAVAARIEAALKTVEGDWQARPRTVRGMDEISAVPKTTRGVFRFAVDLNVAVWPYRFRFAIADGTLDIRTRSSDAGEFDGEAFHRAADALERARRDDRVFACALSKLSAIDTEMVEAAADLHGSIVQNWPPKAADAYRTHRARPNASQAALALRMKMTQQAVSGALRRSRAVELDAAERAIDAKLASAWEEVR